MQFYILGIGTTQILQDSLSYYREMLNSTLGPSRTLVRSAKVMLVKEDFFAKVVALAATKNAALLPSIQIIYVCNVRM
jgi:hypothetical protein